jgi:hypothetical protein
MGNLATVSGTVKGVRINTVMRKDDTGTKQAAMMVRNGGVNSQRTTQTLTTSYVVYQEDLTVDPSDGAAWSISKVNSMELGVVVVT